MVLPLPMRRRPVTTPSPAVSAATTSRKTSGSAQTPAAPSAAAPVDKIVSPVVPQGSPGKFSRRKSSGETRRSSAAAASASRPAASSTKKQQQMHFRPKDAHFQYGNYNRYYGYRNGGGQEDPRLKAMKPEWFKGRDVLGHRLQRGPPDAVPGARLRTAQGDRAGH
ncbi:hypothetical protein MRX96_028829 [Rhipicephalus microplus]